MTQLLNLMQRPLFVHGVVFTLVAAFWAIRMVALPGLSADEAEQVLFAQTFRWGYDVANPPLYTWLLVGLFALFGKSAGLALALKFAILALIYSALYQAARLTLGRDRPIDVALVGLSPLLIFFISWNAIFNYSHSLLNALLVVVTYSTAIKVYQDARWRWFLAFGVVAGLGVLTKYTFVLSLLGLIGAGLTLPTVRARIVSLKMLAALAVAGLIIAPHVWWQVQSMDQLVATVNYKLQIGQHGSYLQGMLTGLWNIVRAVFAFMSPLWLIILVLFGGQLKARDSSVTSAWLGRSLLVVLALMGAMVVFGGITQFRPNYLFLLTLFPLWVFAKIPAAPHGDKRRHVYAVILMVSAVLSLGGLVGKAVLDPGRCDKCQYVLPYADIADALEARGFSGGTLFATWYPVPLAGNLWLHLDDARTVSKQFLTVRPPARATPGQCLIVWVPEEQGGPDTENAIGSAAGNFGLAIGPQTPVTRLRFPVLRAPEKEILIDYVLLDPGAGDCR